MDIQFGAGTVCPKLWDTSLLLRPLKLLLAPFPAEPLIPKELSWILLHFHTFCLYLCQIFWLASWWFFLVIIAFWSFLASIFWFAGPRFHCTPCTISIAKCAVSSCLGVYSLLTWLNWPCHPSKCTAQPLCCGLTGCCLKCAVLFCHGVHWLTQLNWLSKCTARPQCCLRFGLRWICPAQTLTIFRHVLKWTEVWISVHTCFTKLSFGVAFDSFLGELASGVFFTTVFFTAIGIDIVLFYSADAERDPPNTEEKNSLLLFASEKGKMSFSEIGPESAVCPMAGCWMPLTWPADCQGAVCSFYSSSVSPWNSNDHYIF